MRPLTLMRLRGVRGLLFGGHRPPEEWWGWDGYLIQSGKPRCGTVRPIALTPADTCRDFPPALPRLTAPAMRHSDGTRRPYGPQVQSHL